MDASSWKSARACLARLLLWGLLSASLGLSQASAQAAEPEEPAGYRALIDEAVAEYGAQNYIESRALFRKATSMYPSARALRGLGMAEYELRNYADSIDALTRALASNLRTLDGEMRRETERLLAQAESLVGRVDVHVEPATSTVLLDGAPFLLIEGRPLILDIGDHVFEFRAPGYLSERRVHKVRGGEREALRVALAPYEGGAVAAAKQPMTTQSPARQEGGDSPPLYKNKWLWTGVGVAVVAIAVGLGVGLRKDEDGTRAPIALDPAAVRGGP